MIVQHVNHSLRKSLIANAASRQKEQKPPLTAAFK
jgi:hypothetical protein